MQKGVATVEVRVDIHGTAWSVCARARGWVGVGEWHVLRKFCPQRRWKQHTHGLKRIQRCQTPSTIHNHLGSAQSPSSNSLAGLNIAKHHGGWLSVMRYIYRDIDIYKCVTTSFFAKNKLHKLYQRCHSSRLVRRMQQEMLVVTEAVQCFQEAPKLPYRLIEKREPSERTVGSVRFIKHTISMVHGSYYCELSSSMSIKCVGCDVGMPFG